MSASSLDDFDYFHLKTYDVHGIPKGRLVTRQAMNSVLKKGMGMYLGAIFYSGVRGEPNLHHHYSKNRIGNGFLIPIVDTLTPCTKTSRGKFRVGEVLCYVVDGEGNVDATAPRELALSQLATLKEEFGLSIKSSFEIECKIINRKTGEYLAPCSECYGTLPLEEYHDLFLDLVEEMKEIGVYMETVLKEESEGEYEFTIKILEGIQSADAVSKFKSAARLFFKKRGHDLVFMTAYREGGCIGFHFNVSLWTPDGENVFLDTTQPHKLSKMGQHFIAGLVEHGQAMTALVCPTVNCYRRIGAPWAPEFSCWGFDDRYTTFRLKSEFDDNIYLENRLPSAACNTYFVMAATLAAGMDGMRRKLPLPEPKIKNASVALPKSLETALELLDKNKMFEQAFGQEMIQLFTYTKEKYEIDEMKSLGPEASNEKLREKENELYYQRI